MRAVLTTILVLIGSALAGLPRISIDQKGNFVDNKGYIKQFHGVNAVYKIAPYLPQTSHFDAKTSISAEDIADMKSWGFTAVKGVITLTSLFSEKEIRLGVLWNAVEPSPGVYNKTYLAAARQLISDLGTAGIYTIVDFHQDLGHRQWCGEGFPDSVPKCVADSIAETPFPEPMAKHPYPVDENGNPSLDDCLAKAFGLYYPSKAVSKGFQAIYDNKCQLRDQLAKSWGAVAFAFQGMPEVLGYDIINEPWMGDFYKHWENVIPGHVDRKYLQPLYQQVAKQIRKYDSEGLIFFEQSTTDVLTPIFEGFSELPDPLSVLSYHIYCFYTNSSNGDPRSKFLCETMKDFFFEQEMHVIKKLGIPGFLTEFGATSDSGIAVETLQDLLDHAEKHRQSWTWWQFKFFNDLTTASDAAESFYDTNGHLQTEKVVALSRPYPSSVAGELLKFETNHKERTFTATIVPSTADWVTIIKAPKIWCPTPKVTITPEGAGSPGLPEGEVRFQSDHPGMEVTIDVTC